MYRWERDAYYNVCNILNFFIYIYLQFKKINNQNINKNKKQKLKK